MVGADGDDAVTDPATPDAPDIEVGSYASSSARQIAFNYFVAKGLTHTQSAAIVGNLVQESSVDPTSVEVGGGPGRGIAQWSVGARWDTSSHDNMTWYANAHGLARSNLTAQLGFIWYELETYPTYGLVDLRAATTLSQAVVAFQNKFEICGACNQSRRVSSAQDVLAAYGGGNAGCYSGTLGKQMANRACVQSVYDNAWYQCENGHWGDRWSDPNACNGVYPL